MIYPTIRDGIYYTQICHGKTSCSILTVRRCNNLISPKVHSAVRKKKVAMLGVTGLQIP